MLHSAEDETEVITQNFFMSILSALRACLRGDINVD